MNSARRQRRHQAGSLHLRQTRNKALGRAAASACVFEPVETRRMMSFGELDVLFGGGDGIASTNFGAADTARAVAFAPDGKIVAVGSFDGGSANLAVARYNPDGTPDNTFGGGDGRADLTLGNVEHATSVALQSDGKVVVAGYTNATGVGGNDFVVARLNADGAPDNTFGGGDGIQTIDFGFDDRAAAVAVRTDGKIVVGGSIDGGSADFAVARLTNTGLPDLTFDTDGRYSISLGAADFVTSMTLAAGNKILLGGYTSLNASGANTNNFAVIRVNADGGIDNTFGGGDGREFVDFGNDDRANAIATNVNGEIFLVGSHDGGSSNVAVAKFAVNGALDTTYNDVVSPTPSNGDGKLSYTFNGAEFGTAAAIRRDGALVIGGYTNVSVVGGTAGADNNFFVSRVRPSGAIDTSFDGDGHKILNVGANDLAYGLANAPDGSIAIAGTTGDDFVLARLRGALDIGFGAAGKVTTNFGATDTAAAVAVRPDGKIYVGGTFDGGSANFAVARYNADGTPDATFGGGDGRADVTFDGVDVVSDLAVTPDGGVVLVGHTSVGNDWAIAKFTAAGLPDNSFSGDGKLTRDFGFDDRATAVAVRPNGQIVVAGSLDGGSADVAVVQVNPDGTFDPSFGGAGSFGFAGGSSVTFGAADFAQDVALTADGRIIVVGYTKPTDSELADIAVARFTASGGIDNSFSGDGKTTLNVDGNDRAHAVAIDADGRVVIAGQTDDVAGPNFLVVRFSDTGATDLISEQPWNGSEIAYDIAIAADGKYVLAGVADTDDAAGNFAVMRVNPNGLSDTTFDAYGTSNGALNQSGDRFQVNFADGAGADAALGVAIQPDGKIVLAGASNGDFAVTRLSARTAAVGAVFNYETKHEVLINFTAPTNGLTASDFTVQNLGSLAVIPTGTIFLTPAGPGVAQMTFPGQNGNGIAATLPDGNYRLTLPAGSYTDSAGNPNSQPFTFDFFALAGDANRDRKVDIGDFAIVASKFNQPGTFGQGDFNYNGQVEIGDFSILASKFNTQLNPAARSPAAAPSPAASRVAESPRFSTTRIGDDVLPA